MDAQNTVSHESHVKTSCVFLTQTVEGPRAHLSKPTKKVLAEPHLDARNTVSQDHHVKYGRVVQSQKNANMLSNFDQPVFRALGAVLRAHGELTKRAED